LRSRASAILAMAFAVAVPAAAGAASDADALRERATAYWEAKAARSDAVFDFYVPVELGGPTRDDIVEGKQATFASVEVGQVVVNDHTGTVQVKIEVESLDFASPALAMALEENPEVRRRTIQDKWLQVDGVWYRKPRLPFGGRLGHKRTQLAPTDGVSRESSGKGGK